MHSARCYDDSDEGDRVWWKDWDLGKYIREGRSVKAGAQEEIHQEFLYRIARDRSSRETRGRNHICREEKAGLVEGGFTEVVLFHVAFARGIKFGQVDKRISIAGVLVVAQW